VSGPKSGTITGLNKNTGSLVYTPNDGFTGQDRFTFKASDGTVDSNTATVTVKAQIDEGTTVKEPIDKSQVTVKEPIDKSQVTVKEPIDKSQVTVKEPIDRNQDTNVGEKSNSPKENPRQNSLNTNSLSSQGLSRDNG
jgi:hypothetical protein